MKHSQKRDAICEVLRSYRDHPTADMVYARVRGKYPEISLATVYRNLSLLCSEGMVVKIGAEGRERYDIDTSAHTHFFCEECGDIYDIFAPITLCGADIAQEEIGGKINQTSITFRGICKRCLEYKNIKN